MNKRCRNAALLLGLAVLPSARAADLTEVFQLAYANDPTYAAAQADNRATRELRPQAFAQLLPRVDLTADTARHDDHRSSDQPPAFRGEPKDNYNRRGYNLSLLQPVFRLDRWITLSQAKSQIASSDADLEAAFQDLIVRTAEAYFDVLRAEDQVVFAKTTRKAFKQQLNQAEQRFEVGLIAITDVEEAKAGFDIAHTRVIEADNALATSKEELRTITGEYIERLKTMGDQMPLVRPDPDDIAQWTETALTQNRSVAAARYATETSQKEIRRVRAAGHLPTLDLRAQHDYRTQNRSTTFGSRNKTHDNIVGLEFSLPLFQGGGVLSRTREARENYQQTLDALEAERRRAQADARSNFLNVVDSISRVQSLRQQMISTQKAQEAIEAGFQVGTRTSVNVLDAQAATNESVRDFKDARYGYALSALRLKQAAGTLSPEDVAKVNEWLVEE